MFCFLNYCLAEEWGGGWELNSTLSLVPIWNTCLTCLSSIMCILLSRANLSFVIKSLPLLLLSIFNCWSVSNVYLRLVHILSSNMIRKLLSKVRWGGWCCYYIYSCNLCLFVCPIITLEPLDHFCLKYWLGNSGKPREYS